MVKIWNFPTNDQKMAQLVFLIFVTGYRNEKLTA